MPNKPRALDRFADGDAPLGSAANTTMHESPDTRYSQPEKDSLQLEDMSGRVALEGCISPGDVVSGVVCAVVGRAQEDGSLLVEDVLYAGSGVAGAMAVDDEAADGDVFVALVSGLRVGSKGDEPLARQLLYDFLAGHLGGEADAALAARVCRVVIAGNALAHDGNGADAASKAAVEAAAVSLRELDRTLARLVAAVPVDLMPGAADPVERAMPQQPLHPFLVPVAAAERGLHLVTNPHCFDCGDVTFLGTSGQAVHDMHRYMEGSELDVLERSLLWRHVAPSAPDTMMCVPDTHADSLIVPQDMAERLGVFFAGGSAEFATRTVGGRRLVCVPDFAKTRSIVLVNLRTKGCRLVQF